MLTFSTVDELVVGRGCFDRLGDVAAGLGKRALLVTGRHAMRQAGVTDRAGSMLHRAGVQPVLFEGVIGEPTAEQVDAGRALAAEHACDLVVGIGGGGAVDAAKAIAALTHADAPTAVYVRGRDADAKLTLRCIAVPTTSGTGAEVTPNAVISDHESKLKASIRGRGVLPAAALVAPDLTFTCPPEVTAASGMDALTQAIESYVSKHATPVSDALAFQAAWLLIENLGAAYEDGNDADAREACAYGSVMAGVALAHARLGVVHGMAHPLGVRYDIPHGVCCAVLLPHAIELNREAAAGKYDWLSHVAGDRIEHVCRDLLRTLRLPDTFAAYAIPESDFPILAKESMPSGSLKANPRAITEADVIHLLEKVVA